MKLTSFSRPWRGRSLEQWLVAAVLLVALAAHLHHARLGWSFSLSGPQDFRQTQTAIAAYYIAEEGATLSYKIPVLGPEWRIPIEFPTYQVLVAAVHRLGDVPLDQAGRLVSLAAFYLALLALLALLRELGLNWRHSLLIATLVLTSSTYIFYSRSFLIESTAGCLSLAFAFFWLRWQRTKGRWELLGLLVCGALAAVTKFTTFSIIFGFLALLTAIQTLPSPLGESWRGRRLGLAVALLWVPLGAVLLWNQHIFQVWSQSPLTSDFQQGMHAWNFGPWEMRFTPEYWARFYLNSFERTGFPVLGVIVALVAFTFCRFRTRLLVLCCFAAWMSGPLVWANLYFVHDYYAYANHWFLLIGAGLAILALADRWEFLRWPTNLLVLGLAIIQLGSYRTSGYHEAQLFNWEKDRTDFAIEVGAQLEPGEVLFIIGDDWSPFFSYYSQRYSIMSRWPGHYRHPAFQEAITRLEAEGRHFGGALVRNQPEHLADFEGVPFRERFAGSPLEHSFREFLFYPALVPSASVEQPSE